MLADLNIDESAPSTDNESRTPPLEEAPTSQLQMHQPAHIASDSPATAVTYSSPAALGQFRLSGSSLFESIYDSSVQKEELAEGRERKRRRKSWKDVNVWTYSERTPSPEKDDVDAMLVDEVEDLQPPEDVPLQADGDATPNQLAEAIEQPVRLPQSPISTKDTETGDVQSETKAPEEVLVNNQDDEYTKTCLDLSDGNAEASTAEDRSRTAHGRETTTEAERDVPAHDQVGAVEREMLHPSAIDTQPSVVQDDVRTEESEHDTSLDDYSDDTETGSDDEEVSDVEDLPYYMTMGPASEDEVEDDEEDGDPYDDKDAYEDVNEGSDSTSNEEEDAVYEALSNGQTAATRDPPQLMPPPTLSLLQTAAAALEEVSIRGQNPPDAPSTPVLHPVVSATLPLPSPFPADTDAVAHSYVDPSLGGQNGPTQPLAQTWNNLRLSGTSATSIRRLSRGSRASQSSSRDLETEDPFNGRFSAQFPFGLDGSMLSRQEDPAPQSPFRNAAPWLAEQCGSFEEQSKAPPEDQEQADDQALKSASVENVGDHVEAAALPSVATELQPHAYEAIVIDPSSEGFEGSEAVELAEKGGQSSARRQADLSGSNEVPSALPDLETDRDEPAHRSRADGAQHDLAVDELRISHEARGNQPELESSQDLTERYAVTMDAWTPSSPSTNPQQSEELQQPESTAELKLAEQQPTTDAAVEILLPKFTAGTTEIIDLGSESDEEGEHQAFGPTEPSTTPSKGDGGPVSGTDGDSLPTGHSEHNRALEASSSALKLSSHLWEVVKDSEEGSVRSASSLSTMQNSESTDDERMDIDAVPVVQSTEIEEPTCMDPANPEPLRPKPTQVQQPKADTSFTAESQKDDGSTSTPPSNIELVDTEAFHPNSLQQLQPDGSIHVSTSYFEPGETSHTVVDTTPFSTDVTMADATSTEVPKAEDPHDQSAAGLQPGRPVQASVLSAMMTESEDFCNDMPISREEELPQQLLSDEKEHGHDIASSQSPVDLRDGTGSSQKEGTRDRSAIDLQLDESLQVSAPKAGATEICDVAEVAQGRQPSPSEEKKHTDEMVQQEASSESYLLERATSPASPIDEGRAMEGDFVPQAVVDGIVITRPPAADSIQTPSVAFYSTKPFESVNGTQTVSDEINQLLTPDPSQQLLAEIQVQHTIGSVDSVLPPTPQPTQTSLSRVVPLESVLSSSPTMPERDFQGDELPKGRRSVRVRLSTVPDVLSPWFAPRQSSEVRAANLESQSELDSELESEVENSGVPDELIDDTNASETPLSKVRAQLDDTLALPPTSLQSLPPQDSISGAQPRSSPPSSVVTTLQSQLKSRKQPAPSSKGLRTRLSYYTPLTQLLSHLNCLPPSTVDILAVVARATKPPERAAAGPRDYYTVLSVTDPASWPATTQVQVFRPWKAAVPVAETGDVVLLRGFGVKSRKGRAGLLSAEESAWCVWRFEVGRRREEMKGPPVEIGVEEREVAGGLRGWWENVGSTVEDEGDEVDGGDVGQEDGEFWLGDESAVTGYGVGNSERGNTSRRLNSTG